MVKLLAVLGVLATLAINLSVPAGIVVFLLCLATSTWQAGIIAGIVTFAVLLVGGLVTLGIFALCGIKSQKNKSVL